MDLIQSVPPKETLKILIVDDTPYNIYILQELVAQINPSIEITKAHHGKIAIEKIIESKRERKQFFDIIFMDIHMPVLDGY